MKIKRQKALQRIMIADILFGVKTGNKIPSLTALFSHFLRKLPRDRNDLFLYP